MTYRNSANIEADTAAAYGNDLDTIRLVIDAGVDVNAAGVTGVTPLLGASYNANLAAVRLLLSKDANANAVAAMPTLFPIDAPKSGPIALTAVTPLLVISDRVVQCLRSPVPLSRPRAARARAA